MQEYKSLICEAITKGNLVSPDLLDSEANEEALSFLINNPNIFYINKDLLGINKSNLTDINWSDFETTKAVAEREGNSSLYDGFLRFLKEQKQFDSSVKIVSSYSADSEKRNYQDFVLHFNARLVTLSNILRSREGMGKVQSISRILAKKDRDAVSIIGMVKDKRTTKNGNLILTLEDETGEILVLVNKNKPFLFDPCRDIVLDEVLGIIGVCGDKIIFANNVLWPDIPSAIEMKKGGKEGYAIFLSDLHVGSDKFLEKDFLRFIDWINLRVGNKDQKEIASKVKYIFIVGDLVDGVGIYPGQEEELTIKDIYAQYDKCTELLKKIPSQIPLIICGGNHDALRLAEPQPILDNDFTKSLLSLPNITLVSNPSFINIHSSNDFSGYNVLLYHGYSFDHYVANVDSIRNHGGYDRPDLIMKFLLKRRHLSPTHTSTLYVPVPDQDPLIISKIPDIFASGHIHKSGIVNHKSVTLVCGSCWQSKTPFQEKVGHHPEPGRVPIINLQTREFKILKFET